MTRERAIELIRDAIREHEYIKPEDYNLTDTFNDIGADSLDIVEMLILIEEKLKLEFPPVGLGSMTTIEQAIKYLEQYD